MADLKISSRIVPNAKTVTRRAGITTASEKSFKTRASKTNTIFTVTRIPVDWDDYILDSKGYNESVFYQGAWETFPLRLALQKHEQYPLMAISKQP
jgi:hypothetical protein